MSKKVFRLFLFIYLLVILVVGSIPGRPFKLDYIWSFDKLLHIFEFSILAFLAINAVKNQNNKMILLIILLGFSYGGFIEIWQGAVADRHSSINDAIANGIGMIIGSIITVKYLLFSHD